MNARLIAERCPPMPGASRQLGSALPSLCPWLCRSEQDVQAQGGSREPRAIGLVSREGRFVRPTAAFVPPPVSGEGEGQVEEENSVILTNPPPPPPAPQAPSPPPWHWPSAHPCRRLGPCVGDTGASEVSLAEAGAWGGGLRGY